MIILLVTVSKEIFLEMFDLGILSNGKQTGYSVTRKQKSSAKDRYVEEPALSKYHRIKNAQKTSENNNNKKNNNTDKK